MNRKIGPAGLQRSHHPYRGRHLEVRRHLEKAEWVRISGIGSPPSRQLLSLKGVLKGWVGVSTLEGALRSLDQLVIVVVQEGESSADHD